MKGRYASTLHHRDTIMASQVAQERNYPSPDLPTMVFTQPKVYHAETVPVYTNSLPTGAASNSKQYVTPMSTPLRPIQLNIQSAPLTNLLLPPSQRLNDPTIKCETIENLIKGPELQ